MVTSINGIIIFERNYKENDKIITIFSDEGKLYDIRVSNALKYKNKFRNSTQLFSMGCFDIIEYQNRFSSLKNAKIVTTNYELKLDFDVYKYALYFCELIYKVGYYNTLESELYNILITVLNRLMKFNSYQGTKIAFEIQVLKDVGLLPHLNACSCCQNTNVVTLDVKQGGFICNRCVTSNMKNYNIKTLAMLKALSEVNLQSVGEIKVSSLILGEINSFLNEYFDFHLGVKVNSKQFISI